MNDVLTSSPSVDAAVERLPVNSILNKAVGRTAYLMAEGGMSSGDLAALRRISPDEPFTPALWKLLFTLQKDYPNDWLWAERSEKNWSTLLMGMAICEGMHDYDISLGYALADAGWSELRFVQLMRAEGEVLERHVRRVAQYLKSKSQRANWADVARLLFNQENEFAGSVRLRISRDYYRRLYELDQ